MQVSTTHLSYPWWWVCVCVSHWVCLTLWRPRDCSPPAPLSMEFSRQEYWSGLPCPSPGESSQPRDWTQVSHIEDKFFTAWDTRVVLVVYICQFESPDSSLLFPYQCPHISSLPGCLHSCPADRFICTGFLESTYLWNSTYSIYFLDSTIFVFLFLTLLCTADSGSINISTNDPTSFFYVAE